MGGSFGKTVLLQDPFTDELFVAKMYKPQYDSMKEKFFKNFIDEIKIMYKLYHPNPDKPEKLFLFSPPCVILKKKGVFICYSLINTLIKFMASLPVMTA